MARYVIALLKKDKSDKDLKRIMIEQLDVFLSEETTRFVERLFDAIASEEYLTLPAPLPSTTNSATAAAELDLDHELALAIDGAHDDIEAVLAADSPPPPAPKDNVITPESNQTALEQVSHDAREAEALAFVSQEGGFVSSSSTDAKTAFDVSFIQPTRFSSCCKSFLAIISYSRKPKSPTIYSPPPPTTSTSTSTICVALAHLAPEAAGVEVEEEERA